MLRRLSLVAVALVATAVLASAAPAARVHVRVEGMTQTLFGATEPLLDYQVPGIAEAMRRAGSDATPTAILSRGLAGVRGHSLLVNLPGSRRGALESLNAVLPALGHGIALLRGEAVH